MLYQHVHRFMRIFVCCAMLIMLVLPNFASADNFWSWDEDGKEDDTITEAIPSYWLEELQKGAQEINTALMEVGWNKSAFLFYTDSHWNYNSQQSPLLLKYLYDHTGINRTIFGGDIVTNEGSDYETMSYLWDWRNKIRQLPNHHSVVGNHDDGNTTNHLFDEDYVYGYLLAPEETPDIVRGEKGLYYYIDSPSEKTRYLFLDTAFQEIYFYPDQVQFLIDSLSSVAENWHIVVIAHRWYDVDYSNEYAADYSLSYVGKLVLNVLDAYNQRQSGVVRSRMNLTDNAVSNIPYNFKDCKGKVEFCIGGHIHRDFDGSSNAGIPVILVETDSYNTRSGLNKDSETINESSVNGIIADYDARKVMIIRVGRGESRVVPLK